MRQVCFERLLGISPSSAGFRSAADADEFRTAALSYCHVPPTPIHAPRSGLRVAFLVRSFNRRIINAAELCTAASRCDEVAAATLVPTEEIASEFCVAVALMARTDVLVTVEGSHAGVLVALPRGSVVVMAYTVSLSCLSYMLLLCIIIYTLMMLIIVAYPHA